MKRQVAVHGTFGRTVKNHRSTSLLKNRHFSNKEQKKFLRIAAMTWIMSLALFIIGKHTLHVNPGNWADMGVRFHFIVQCLVFASLPLVAGILTVAVQRLNPRNLIGQKLRTDLPVDINRQYIRNTVEQFLLFTVAQLAMAGFADAKTEAISFVLLTALFVIGRLIFWFGYHHDKFTRALGFGLTFYPIVGAYAWVICRILTGWAPQF